MNSANFAFYAFSDLRLHDLPTLKHAADENRLVEGSCCGGYPLLYATYGAI
jgi:hypothetical protein